MHVIRTYACRISTASCMIFLRLFQSMNPIYFRFFFSVDHIYALPNHSDSIHIDLFIGTRAYHCIHLLSSRRRKTNVCGGASVEFNRVRWTDESEAHRIVWLTSFSRLISPKINGQLIPIGNDIRKNQLWKHIRLMNELWYTAKPFHPIEWIELNSIVFIFLH